MRGWKIIGYGLGGLVLLVVLLLLGVTLLVNPNDFKGRIVREVRSATGRELTLAGDIKLAVFPWIALELGPLSLGNPPGFGSEPFLSVQRVALRVRLWPLLHKELQVGRIEVKGLDLRLQKNAAGRGNWQGLGGEGAAPTARGTGADSGASGSLAGIGGVSIADSRVSYGTLTLAHLNLDAGEVSQRGARRYALAGVTLAGDLQLGAQARAVEWRFALPALELDLAAQTLRGAEFAAQFGDAKLSGALAGTSILDAPAFSGSWKLEPLEPRALLARFGSEAPKTRDPKALSAFEAASGFSYAHGGVRLEKLEVRLDDTHLRGAAAITNLSTLATTFEFAVDRIDLDRYRAPAPAAAVTRSAPSAAQPAVELPTSALRPLNLEGKLSLEAVTVAGLHLSNVRVGLRATEGIVHLAPISARLYGGEYAGDILYDAHAPVPALKMDQQVLGVEMAPLLKDGVKSERLSGRGNASAKFAGAGRTSEAMLRGLEGRVEAHLANGAVNGIDLGYQINRAQALLKQQASSAVRDEGRTKFDAFRMSVDIAGGVASTQDLEIASQYLKVTGKGNANLLTHAIDYHLLATILKAPPGAAGANPALTLANIPVEVGGTMSDPKVRPDLQGILKSQLKEKLQDTLKDKLKNLLGAPR